MKFKITKVNDKITVEVLKKNIVLLTEDFDINDDIHKIRKTLKQKMDFIKIKQEEKQRIKKRKQKFKKMLNKEMDL